MKNPIAAAVERVLWDREPATPSEARLLRLGKYVAVIVRDVLDGQLSMRAMSLVYTTLLSMVPLLALAFSVLKALGVHNSLEPVLRNVLRPLGDEAVEVTRNIIGFVENIKVGVLGSLGVALLLYAAVSMIQKVEGSFNYIWRIERQRPFGQRFGEYLSVLIVGPVVVFSALGITASFLNSAVVARIASVEPLGFLVALFSQLLPYILIMGFFTFLYSFVPNTAVRWRAALGGGLLAGVLWQSASLVFASFVKAATNYNAVYTGFAIVIFLLIWLYLGWLILLLGCQLSFYLQRPEHLTPHKLAPFLSARTAEALALSIVGMVGGRYLRGEPGPTEDDLARSLGAAPEHVDKVIEVLLHQGVLAETGEQDGARFLPGRDLDGLPVSRLWQLVRSGFDPPERIRAGRGEMARNAIALLETAEGEFADGKGRQSVRDWLQELGPREKPDAR